MLADSHAHLTSKAFPASEVPAVLQRAREAGVSLIMNVAVGEGLDGCRECLDFAHQYKGIYPVVGFHPHEAAAIGEADMLGLRELLAANPSVCAVGEIGLDHHYDFAPRPVQQRVFAEQLVLAQELDLPVVIHSREAEAEVRTLLASFKRNIPGVMHCFSGTVADARYYLDRGWYISISGVVTFKKALETQEVASYVPLDRLLVETDCPYLAPIPYRGKRCEPAHVRLTAEFIAGLRNIDRETLCRHFLENTRQVFEIKNK